LILLDHPLDLQDLSTAESSADLQANRGQPKFRGLVFTFNMDMRRLVPISGVEEESIRPSP
jgi:hypothetical protein